MLKKNVIKMDEIVVTILCMIVTAIICLPIGYSWATKDAILIIDRINRWLDSTESDQWVHAQMYMDLEEKYNKLLKEHEQYRGMIKAIEDIKGD